MTAGRGWSLNERFLPWHCSCVGLWLKESELGQAGELLTKWIVLLTAEFYYKVDFAAIWKSSFNFSRCMQVFKYLALTSWASSDGIRETEQLHQHCFCSKPHHGVHSTAVSGHTTGAARTGSLLDEPKPKILSRSAITPSVTKGRFRLSQEAQRQDGGLEWRCAGWATSCYCTWGLAANCSIATLMPWLVSSHTAKNAFESYYKNYDSDKKTGI